MSFTTHLSDDRLYRYTLWRQWTDEVDPKFAMFIGLNPSTADEKSDDATIRKCIGFAKQWGFGGLLMTNLFAWRATHPKDMKASAEPVGEENDVWLLAGSRKASAVIAAWGNDGSHLGRAQRVLRMCPMVYTLRRNKDGSPGHPLYIPYSASPQPYIP